MHIAIMALNAYPAVLPSSGTRIGGLENFAWTLATELAQQPSIDVSLLVRHTRSLDSHNVRGVQLVETIERLRNIRRDVSHCLERQQGFPWVRLRSWNWSLSYKVPLLAIRRVFGPAATTRDRIERMLDRSRPDVLVAMGVNADSAAALKIARQRNLPALLWVRSNMDLEEQFTVNPEFVSACGARSIDFRESVQASQIVLCQTEWQRDQLKRLTGIEATIIKTPVDLARFSPVENATDHRSGVLWIGRYDRFHKRPLLAIEIAKRCPSLHFRMIINRNDEEVRTEVLSDMPANVEIVDYVPRDETPSLYRQARIFLSTSAAAVEGFPNVLLEAAATGTPIVSLEEFDHFIASSRAGIVTGLDVEAAALSCRQLSESSAQWSECSAAGPQYVARQHSVEATVHSVIAVAKSLTKR